MTRFDPDRDRRLAEALRQNLRRRKAQARELSPGADNPTGQAPPQESVPDEGDEER